MVRTLKTAKSDKAAIDEAVKKLLALKRALAIAQGQDPDAAKPSSGKSKSKNVGGMILLKKCFAVFLLT